MRRLGLVAALGLLAVGGATAQPIGLEVAPGVVFDLPLVLEPFRPAVTGPVDPRFFGTYCQPSPKEFCKSVPILPDPCVTLRDMRVELDHLTSPTGGLLVGGGRFVLDGERGVLGIAGSITRRGRARFSTSAPGLGRVVGASLRLSSDGLALTASVQSRSITLRKDACGNNPPTVGLTAPFGPTFPFGQSVMLAGQITDEDTTFPEERLVFTSNRQGVLRGTRVAGGRTLFTTSLVPGNHRITFTVTDSGGLTRSADLDIAVVSRAPQPRIFLPAENATLVAGAPVLLQGQGYDEDSGFLPDSSLLWSAQLTPGGPFVPLGTGSERGAVFADPANAVRLRLTATDSGGLTGQIERTVAVVTGTGNGPPVAVIRQPDRRQVNGTLVAGFFSFQPANFVGEAWDAEDTPPDLELAWEVVAIASPGGAPLASPPVPNPAPVTGTLAPVVNFDPAANGFYRVIFRVTDQGGLTTTDSIDIYVTPNVIL